MSVLTEDQREYMDSVLKNQSQRPDGSDANGVPPIARTASPASTKVVKLAQSAVDHLLYYDDDNSDDPRGDRKTKAKAKAKKGEKLAGTNCCLETWKHGHMAPDLLTLIGANRIQYYSDMLADSFWYW
jgi:hypothetical protein